MKKKSISPAHGDTRRFKGAAETSRFTIPLRVKWTKPKDAGNVEGCHRTLRAKRIDETNAPLGKTHLTKSHHK
jgi:hypothetical protein